jgi:2-C-methyl-D-erythritol 2,4-cyclodiphosphate synthase
VDTRYQLPRVGIGADVHAYDPSRPCWIAGLHWADSPGLAGHSDGDVVSHAICDALFSAAGLGDMGTNFGTDSPQWAQRPGVDFISETVRRVQDAEFLIGNVAVQLIGHLPKLGTRRQEAEQVLSAALTGPVTISATTTDNLGFTGRGEGLAAIATALIVPLTNF